MPIFPFSCNDCGKEWEAFQGGIVDPDSKACPNCQSSQIKKGFAPTRGYVRSITTQPSTMSEFEELGMVDAAKRHQQWLESPEVAAKVKSGEMELKAAGPKEFQPSYLQ